MAQTTLGIRIIKQYPGRLQADRKVKVKVPGKHFPGLSTAELQKEFYEGTAVEYVHRRALLYKYAEREMKTLRL